MIELSKCPFCGGEAELIRMSTNYSTNPTTIKDCWYVKCTECNAYKEGYSKIYQNDAGEVIVDANGAEIAIEKWNSRSGE